MLVNFRLRRLAIAILGVAVLLLPCWPSQQAVLRAEPPADTIAEIEKLERKLVEPDFAATERYVSRLAEMAAKRSAPTAAAARWLDEAQRLRFAQVEVDAAYVRLRLATLAYGEILRGSLPVKAPAARAMSAFTLFKLYTGSPIPSKWVKPDQLDSLRNAVLKDFALLPSDQQQAVLFKYWRRLGSPQLAPVLRAAVEEAPDAEPDFRNGVIAVRLPDLALRQLYGVAPDAACELIMAEIRRPRPHVGLDALLILPDQPIPELDDLLKSRLSEAVEQPRAGQGAAEGDWWKSRHRRESDIERQAVLINRYGSAELESRVLEALDKQIANDSKVGCAELLSYLLKHDPALGVRMVNKVLDERAENGLHEQLLGDLAMARLAPELESMAISRLNDADEQVAVDAAYVAGLFATPAAWKALVDRLRSWHDQQTNLDLVAREIDSGQRSPFDDFILQQMCDNPRRVMSHRELRELRPFCVSQQAKDNVDGCLSESENPVRIDFFPGEDSEFCYPGWPSSGGISVMGPIIDDIWHAAQYPAGSQAELKALLARFQRGTVFSLPPQISTDAAEDQQFFEDLRRHVEKHGMTLVKAKF